ncbi:MAG: ATP-binding protein [Magnetococcus sp. YQC-9]
MTHTDRAILARTRTRQYWSVSLLLVTGYLIARHSTWVSSTHLHTLLEALATLLAFLVGALALMRYHTEKEDLYLFVGAGFLGTALLDLYHTIVTSAAFIRVMPSNYATLIPWSWLSSRIFLSFFLVLSWFFTRRSTTPALPAPSTDPRWVFRGMGLFTLANLLFFMLMPLPRAIYPEWLFPRPQEWIPALLFLIALLGFLTRGLWRENPFEHWLVLALLVNFWGEALFMPSSGQLYDAMFDLGHVLKKISYLLVLIGLLVSILVISFDLKRARIQAETASRSKSAFLANMSHEIRTPMNGVLGMIELALNVAISPVTREYLLKAQASSRTLLRLINDILDLSKIEQGAITLERVNFRLPDLLADVADLFAPNLADKDLRLDIITPSKKIEWLIGDPFRLQQVLYNLVGNAVKFTPHGRITVSVEAFGREVDMERIHFRVMDEGIGISPDKQAALFAPFTQADESTTRRFGGTGLGLAICKRLVEMMDGRIWLQSTPGRGSTFHFTVLLGLGQPVTDGAVWQAGAVPRRTLFNREALVKYLGGARVLLVEDLPVNRQVAEELLKGVGLVVESAENGQEALRRLEKEAFDLVLMDIQMPVMDGLTATRALRADARWQTLPILAMSAHALHEDRLESLNAGMNDHIVKPIDSAQLYAALMHWIPPRDQRMAGMAMATATEASDGSIGEDDIRFEALTCIAVDELLERVNDNTQLARLLLSEFVRGQEASIEQLERWLESGGAEERSRATQLVHSLKGMAGNLAAKRVYEAAMALEQGLRVQHVGREIWSSLLAEFKLALMQMVEEIHAWQLTEAKVHAGRAMENWQAWDPREVSASLHRLKPLLVQQDFDAQAAFKRLLPQLQSGSMVHPEWCKWMGEMDDHLDQLEFSKAHGILECMVEALEKEP